jgi:hypothetical protein
MKGACRSCGAEIVWARTVNGKTIPIDVDPVEDGNIELQDGAGAMPVAVYVKKDDGQLGLLASDRYVSHFATCPQAKEWRRE